MVFLLDRAGCCLEFQAAEGLQPYVPVEQFLGRPMAEVLPPAVGEQINSALDRAFALGQPEAVEYQLVEDHGPTEYEARIVPSGPDEAICLVRDISRRKSSERERRSSETKYRALFEHASDAIFTVTHPDGDITDANVAASAMLGYTSEEFLRLNGDLIIVPEVLDSTDAECNAQLAANGSFQIEMLWVHADGSRIPVAVTGKAIVIDDQSVFQIIGRDISTRKAEEAARAELEKRLRHSQRLETIGTLAGGIAHDFNNLLTPILGFSTLVLDELGEDNALRRDVVKITVAAGRARDLVRQLLTFAGRAESSRRLFRMSDVLTEALTLVRAALPTTIEVREDVQDGDATIDGDSSQLHQVVVNLCTNAFHAMEDDRGMLDVSLRRVEHAEDLVRQHGSLPAGEYVRLVVRDNGRGMDAVTEERLFEPFFSAPAVDGGTGLGLSVVHGIVTSHGGVIFANSELGAGSVFEVFLPVAHSTSDVAAPAEGSESCRGSERILFVDDSDEVAQVCRRMLESLGYHVEVNTDSRAALEMLRDQPAAFDLVISDQVMPGFTGLQLATALRESGIGTPVILISGFSDLGLSGDLPPNVQETLGKPLTVHQLGSAVRRVIDCDPRGV